MEKREIECIRNIIRKNIESTENIEHIKNDDELSDFGLNSISFVKVVAEIEKVFGIEFEIEVMLAKKFKTIDAFVSYVDYKMQKLK